MEDSAMSEMKPNPFHDLELKLLRFALFALTVLGLVGVLAFAIKHLYDFILSLWGH